MASSVPSQETTAVDHAEDAAELTEPIEVLESSVDDAPAENEELSPNDRFQQRLDRFGKIAPEAKKASRALRFGTAHEAVDGAAKKRRLERFGAVPHSTEDEQEKKKSRSQRFHTNNASPAVDNEAKQKRLDRFGLVSPPTSSAKKTGDGQSASASPVLSESIKKRTERFGDVSQAAKANTQNEQKAKRGERFKPVTSV